MKEKHDADYENKIIFLAEQRVKTGKYKLFDYRARVITRDQLPEVVARGKSDDESCLVIANSDGETIVITREFERILLQALRDNF